MSKSTTINLFICSIAIAMACSSCRKDQEPQGPVLPEPKDSIEVINRWILDSMLRHYLWSDQIPGNPSLAGAPEDFFKKLISTEDKFSWISNGAGIAPEKTTFQRFGFHYLIIQHPASAANTLTGIVTMVASESPADRAGIKRGDYFSRVNNQTISTQNISTIRDQLHLNPGVSITTATNSNGTWIENNAKTLSTAYFEERVVLKRKIFSQNNISTGYLCLTNFNDLFDKEMLDAIDTLHKRNVSELILDLRYNTGGSVASVAKLTAAILNSIDARDIFSIYKGNSRWGTIQQSFESAINSSTNAYRRNFSQLNSSSLNLSRIFVLTGPGTASAAEMVINNLKPYINIIQIGESTTGKDKAGILIRDGRQPRQILWSIQAILFQVYNSNNQGNYSPGLIPQHVLPEYSQLPILDFGNREETLISKALTLIYGSDAVSTESYKVNKQDQYPFSSSLIKYNSHKSEDQNFVNINIHH